MGAKCWRESNGLGWKDFEGVRRTSRRARMVRGHRPFRQGRNLRQPRLWRAEEGRKEGGARGEGGERGAKTRSRNTEDKGVSRENRNKIVGEWGRGGLGGA